jgi:hypothetical protein
MSTTVEKELAALEKMTTSDLQATYRELFGDAHAITGSHWNGYHFFREALLHAREAEEAR